jgi:hypothetical protein
VEHIFKGLCASQLESDIREACVLGAKHFSDDKAKAKAKDKAGDSVFLRTPLSNGDVNQYPF